MRACTGRARYPASSFRGGMESLKAEDRLGYPRAGAAVAGPIPGAGSHPGKSRPLFPDAVLADQVDPGQLRPDVVRRDGPAVSTGRGQQAADQGRAEVSRSHHTLLSPDPSLLIGDVIAVDRRGTV